MLENNVMYNEAEKKMVDAQHEKGYKVMVVGQPLAGKDVPKATYVSCINLFNPNSMIDLLQKYKVTSTIKILSDFPMDANRNRLVVDSMSAGIDYIFFMDMDQTFPPDALTNLFEIISDDRPIVAGMYYLKKEPYPPVLGRYVDWDDSTRPYRHYYEKKGFVDNGGKPLMTFRAITYFDKTTPFTADVIGLGCVLMKTSIFKTMEYPYFRYTNDPRPGKEYLQMDEVMHFCAQLKKRNVPIWVDPRVQCGHLTTLETNVSLYEACRDARFKAHAQQDPKDFDRISKLFVDVREEQANGTRF